MGKVMAAIGQYSLPSYGPVSFPQIPTSASIAQQGPAPQIGHSPALHVVYRAAPVRNAAPTPGPVAQLMGLNPSIGLVGQWMPLPADPPPDCPPGLEYLSVMVIQAPEGVPIGCVSRIWHPFEPKFCVNVSGETVLNISAPCRLVSCFSDDHFRVLGSDNVTVVGKISNKFTGVAAEYFTNSDSFGVQFPVDLDVTIKATLIGASFLIVL
ncbi:Phospholipid scramblase 2 [Acipenser ruthenus]|uniref:Phospholipid scramblase n=1 Tax=Acipenser ruthenus TaxID=7906 RepID=A0A444UPW7_ACIRT|nr:Phospholipid scramblase 2 [Acipenser ruthenus]